jgi:radical SAM superfamily enzyme YgiQ (UPF0313 family)
MRLLLVYPGNKNIGDKSRGKSRRIPFISLPIIANLTPPEWEIGIVDEESGEKINYDGGYDLVGISSMTSQAPRAYRIAEEFRARGVPVVHGGSHPTVCPEEALLNGDAVVAGEAERSWPQLLRDFAEHGKVQHRIYRHTPRQDEPWYVPPRREFMKPANAYPITPVVATRGCPFTCSFCSVSSVFGRGYRHRSVEDVIAEIKVLRASGEKNIVFLDDNIMGEPVWSKALFRALTPLGVRWAGQAHLGAARDPELIELARRSGLFALFIGVESVNKIALAGVRKGINDVARYHEWVKVYHDNGVFIFAGMIFGLDDDEPSVFVETVEALDRLDIAVGNFSLLVPLPGTEVHRKLQSEGRIIDTDWSHYDGSHLVYRPTKLTPEQLLEGSRWAAREYFTIPRIVRRFGSNWRNPFFYWTMSLAYMCKQRSQYKASGRLGMEPRVRGEVLLSCGIG